MYVKLNKMNFNKIYDKFYDNINIIKIKIINKIIFLI